jgi:hypothetical protein
MTQLLPEDDAPESPTAETVNPYEGHEDEAQDPDVSQ